MDYFTDINMNMWSVESKLKLMP